MPLYDEGNGDITSTMTTEIQSYAAGMNVMCFSRLAIVAVVVSMSVAAQTPQKGVYAYLCEPEFKYQDPFPHPAAISQQSTPYQYETGIDWAELISPPEFRPHGLTAANKTRISPQPPRWPPEGCHLIHIDEKGEFH